MERWALHYLACYWHQPAARLPTPRAARRLPRRRRRSHSPHRPPESSNPRGVAPCHYAVRRLGTGSSGAPGPSSTAPRRFTAHGFARHAHSRHIAYDRGTLTTLSLSRRPFSKSIFQSSIAIAHSRIRHSAIRHSHHCPFAHSAPAPFAVQLLKLRTRRSVGHLPTEHDVRTFQDIRPGRGSPITLPPPAHLQRHMQRQRQRYQYLR